MKIFKGKFKKVYLFGMTAACIGIICWLVFFWLRLDAFEKSIPENVASQIFSQYFEGSDFQKLYQWEKSSFSDLESSSNYTAYLLEKAGGREMRLQSIRAVFDDTKKFAVFSGGDIFAEFELRQDDGFFGKIWELSGVNTFIRTIEPFEIIVPEGYSVLVGGMPVSQSYKSSSAVQCIFAGSHDIYTIENMISHPVVEVREGGGTARTLTYNEDANVYSAIPTVQAKVLEGFTLYINGIPVSDSFLTAEGERAAETDRLRLTRKTYTFYSNFDDPELTVKSLSGIEGSLVYTEDGNFFQEIVYDSELEALHKDYAIDAAMTYARFITNNSTLAELRRYFEAGTPIFEVIRTTEVYWYTTHLSYWFENVNASEFVKRDEDTFSARVTFDQFIRRTARDLHQFPLDVTLFIRNVDGRFLVYDMISNA